MIRILTTLSAFCMAAIIVLSSCSSGKVAFEHGNYYQAVITSVAHLRRNPGHKKSTETLIQAYPLAVTYFESQASAALASNAQFKWTQVVNSYISINSMYDEIQRSPGALAVIPHPTNYSAKLQEAKQNAAEEQYSAGIMALGAGTRDKAKEAYQYFKTTIGFVPGYKDAQKKMEEALWAATIKVLVEPIPTQGSAYASNTEYLNNKLSEYLHTASVNEFVKFFTYQEAQTMRLNPDHVVRLDFDEFTVGNVFMSEKQIPLKRDSVWVSALVNNQIITINNVVNNTNVTNNNTVNNTTVNNNTVNNTVNNNTTNNNTTNNTTNNNTVNNNTTNNNTSNNTVNNNTTNNNTSNNTVNNNTTSNNTANNNTTNNTSNNTVNNNTTNNTSNNTVNNNTTNNNTTDNNATNNTSSNTANTSGNGSNTNTSDNNTTNNTVNNNVTNNNSVTDPTEVKEEKKEDTKEVVKEEKKDDVKDFAVETSGAVAVKENVCATLKCLGEAVVYSNTQDAFVKITYSIDNGIKWFDFNNANFVKGGEQTTVQVPNGSQVVFKALVQTENGSWTNTLTTNASSEWVYVLRNGDKAPNIAPAQNQTSVETFLKGVITDGKISIGPNDVIYLFELRHVGNIGVDYQDAVMLITFGADANCLPPQNQVFEAIPENEQVVICHVPPGNASGRHTLTISKSALKSHLDHGDFEGSCEDPKNANKLKEVDKKATDQNKNDKGGDNKGNDRKGGGGFVLADYQPMLIASASNDVAWMSLLSSEAVDTTKIYASVKATMNYFAKTVSSKGVVRMTILDTKTKAVLSSTQIPSEYVWSSEWATFNGDERALSTQQLELTKKREQVPPSKDELFRAVINPIFDQITVKIKEFYKGY